MEKIEIYTDGSCYPNDGTGRGGWSYVIVIDNSEIHSDNGGESPSTNNRMELTAIINAMEFCMEEVPHNNITIYTDNTYCKNGYNSWMYKWKRYEWKNSYGEIKNRDLWEKLYELKGFELKWVKGHSGNKWNERADELANYKNKEKLH